MNENQDKARLGDRLMPVDETGTEEGLLKVNYRDPEFIERLRQHHAEYGFTLQFDQDGKIVVTDETSSQIITALLDHRLTSEFSKRTYDVPSAIPITV